MFIGIANALSKFRKTSLPYIKNNLKLYLDFKSNKSDTLKFPCEGSTSFDGVDDYIDCGDINAMDGASQLTMSAWMKRFASDDIVVVEKSTDNNDRVGLHLGSDGKIYYIMSTGSGITHGSVALAGTDWNYVVGVFDGSLADNASRLKIYVNGVLQTLAFSGTIPATTPSSSAPLLIGKDIPNSQFSTGKMANVAIWNRVLSIEEINSVMRKNYSQLGSVEKTSLVMWQSLDSVDATGHMDTPGTSTTILTSFPTNIYLNSHGTTEYTEVMANNGNLTTQGAWNFQSGGTDSAFADTGVYSEGALKIKNVVIARVAVNSTNASVLEALIVGQLYKLEITYTRVEGQHAQAVYIGLNNSYGGSGSDVKWKEGYWNTDDDDAAEKTITGYFFHESGKNELWIRCPSSSIELHFKTISLKKVTNNAGGGGITPSHNNNHYDATLAQGATTTTSVYGGNAPVLPRSVSNEYGEAEAIGDGSALFNGTSDYIDCGADVYDFSSSDFTVSAWVYHDRESNHAGIIGVRDSTNTELQIYLLDSNAKIASYNGTDAVNSASAVPEAEWTHIAVAQSGGSKKFYINGILDDTVTQAKGVARPATLRIGHIVEGGAEYFKGNISQVGVWAGELTQAQIQSVMESTSYAKIPADVKSTLGSDELPSPDLTSGTGLTISQGSTGELTHDTSAGTITATNDVQDGYLRWFSANLVENKLYKLEIVVDSYTGGRFRTTLGWNGTSFYPSVGTNIQYFIGSSTASFGIRFDDGNPAEFVISKISVKEVTNDLVGYWALDADNSNTSNGVGIVSDSVGGETLGVDIVDNNTASAWTTEGTNSDANITNGVRLTYGSSAGGNYAYINDTLTSLSGLATNTLYKSVCTVSYSGGTAPTLTLHDGTTAFNQTLTTTPTEYTFYFEKNGSPYLQITNQNSGNVTDVINWSVKEVTSNTGVLK